MKQTKLLAAVALILPAMAHGQGWYAGIDVGDARSDSSIDESPIFAATTARSSGSTTGFRLRGGYQFGRFVAVELAYVDFGDVESHFDPSDCANGSPGPCPFDVRSSQSGLIGTVVGVVFAPQIYGALRKMRRQLSEAAAEASDAATERYQEATAQAGDAVDDLHQKGVGAYGRALGVVARAADEVREYATDARAGLDERPAHVSLRPL